MQPSKIIWIFVCFSSFVVSANGKTDSYHVMLHVFSGTRDPEWVLTSSSSGYKFLADNLPRHSSPLASRLGYSGFTIEKYHGSHLQSSVSVGRCSHPVFEGDLLDVVKSLIPVSHTSPLSPAVIQYASQDIDAC